LTDLTDLIRHYIIQNQDNKENSDENLAEIVVSYEGKSLEIELNTEPKVNFDIDLVKMILQDTDITKSNEKASVVSTSVLNLLVPLHWFPIYFATLRVSILQLIIN